MFKKLCVEWIKSYSSLEAYENKTKHTISHQVWVLENKLV